MVFSILFLFSISTLGSSESVRTENERRSISPKLFGQHCIKSVHNTYVRHRNLKEIDASPQCNKPCDQWMIEEYPDTGKILLKPSCTPSKYLSAERNGSVSLRKWRLANERWLPLQNEDGSWSLESAQGKWLRIQSNGVVSVSTNAGEDTKFWLEPIGEAPRWIDIPPASSNASEGDTVSFACAASGSPKPTVSFYRNGVAISALSREGYALYVIEDAKLTIGNVRKDSYGRGDNAIYQCKAENEHGYVWANFRLDVYESASFLCSNISLSRLVEIPQYFVAESTNIIFIFLVFPAFFLCIFVVCVLISRICT